MTWTNFRIISRDKQTIFRWNYSYKCSNFEMGSEMNSSYRGRKKSRKIWRKWQNKYGRRCLTIVRKMRMIYMLNMKERIHWMQSLTKHINNNLLFTVSGLDMYRNRLGILFMFGLHALSSLLKATKKNGSPHTFAHISRRTEEKPRLNCVLCVVCVLLHELGFKCFHQI